MDFVGIAVSAAIQGLVGLVIWAAVRRNLERVDRLEGEIGELKDRRIGGLEQAFRDHEELNRVAREELFKELRGIHTGFVNKADCFAMHREMTKQFDRFSSAVIDLARVQERNEQLAGFIEEVNNRVISTMQDVSKIQGEIEKR